MPLGLAGFMPEQQPPACTDEAVLASSVNLKEPQEEEEAPAY